MSGAPSSLGSGASQRGRGGLIAWAIILGALLIAVIVVIALTLRGLLPFGPAAAAQADAAPTTLTLEPANAMGDNPFSSTPLANDVNVATPSTGPAPNLTAVPSVVVSGAGVGLYGGSEDPGVCKIDQLVAFLKANPAKAQAWVDAFNEDPNLRWTKGLLTVADIPAYIATLTPVILQNDTRVTNHGFDDSSGTSFPLQSLLQAGMAVLVDQYMVPRVKCKCGNPLIPPVDVRPPDQQATPPGGGGNNTEEPCTPFEDGSNPDDCTSTPPGDTTTTTNGLAPCPPALPGGEEERIEGLVCDNSLYHNPLYDDQTGSSSSTDQSPDTNSNQSPDTNSNQSPDANVGEITCNDTGNCYTGDVVKTPYGTFEVTGMVSGTTPSGVPLSAVQVIDRATNTLKVISVGCVANGACSITDAAANPYLTPDPGSSASPVPSPSSPAPTRTPYTVSSVCNLDQTNLDPMVRRGSITNNSSDYVDVYAASDDGSCSAIYLGEIAPGQTDTSFYGPDGAVFIVGGNKGQQNFFVNGDPIAFTY